MLKEIFMLLLLMALGNILCKAQQQQYFTGTIVYKFLNKDTGVNIHMRVLHGNSFINFITEGDSNNNNEAGELIYDWGNGCCYGINYSTKEITKSKLYVIKYHAEKIRTDSLSVFRGLTARLYRIYWTNDMVFNAWYADSLFTTIPDSLAESMDLSFFGMGRVLLKVEVQNGHLPDSSGYTGFYAEKIIHPAGSEVLYHLPVDYRIIDETVQQKISDSLMQEFKTVDSSLLLSEKDFETRLNSAVRQVKGLDDEPADSQQKAKKTPPGKRKLNHVKKQPARKPGGFP